MKSKVFDKIIIIRLMSVHNTAFNIIQNHLLCLVIQLLILYSSMTSSHETLCHAYSVAAGGFASVGFATVGVAGSTGIISKPAANLALQSLRASLNP
jgi:hypothetical protein